MLIGTNSNAIVPNPKSSELNGTTTSLNSNQSIRNAYQIVGKAGESVKNDVFNFTLKDLPSLPRAEQIQSFTLDDVETTFEQIKKVKTMIEMVHFYDTYQENVQNAFEIARSRKNLCKEIESLLVKQKQEVLAINQRFKLEKNLREEEYRKRKEKKSKNAKKKIEKKIRKKRDEVLLVKSEIMKLEDQLKTMRAELLKLESTLCTMETELNEMNVNKDSKRMSSLKLTHERLHLMNKNQVVRESTEINKKKYLEIMRNIEENSRLILSQKKSTETNHEHEVALKFLTLLNNLRLKLKDRLFEICKQHGKLDSNNDLTVGSESQERKLFNMFDCLSHVAPVDLIKFYNGALSRKPIQVEKWMEDISMINSRKRKQGQLSFENFTANESYESQKRLRTDPILDTRDILHLNTTSNESLDIDPNSMDDLLSISSNCDTKMGEYATDDSFRSYDPINTFSELGNLDQSSHMSTVQKKGKKNVNFEFTSIDVVKKRLHGALKSLKDSYNGETFDLTQGDDQVRDAKKFMKDFGFVVVKCDDVMSYGKPEDIPLNHKYTPDPNDPNKFEFVFNDSVGFKKIDEIIASEGMDINKIPLPDNYGYLPKSSILDWCLACIIEEGRFVDDMGNIIDRHEKNGSKTNPFVLDDNIINDYMLKIYNVRMSNYLNYENALLKKKKFNSSIYEASSFIDQSNLETDVSPAWKMGVMESEKWFQKYMLARGTGQSGNNDGNDGGYELSSINILDYHQYANMVKNRQKTGHRGMINHSWGLVLDGWSFEDASDLIDNSKIKTRYNPLVNEPFFWMARSLASNAWGKMLDFDPTTLVAEPQPLFVVHTKGGLKKQPGLNHFPLSINGDKKLYGPDFYNFKDFKNEGNWVRNLDCTLEKNPYHYRKDHDDRSETSSNGDYADDIDGDNNQEPTYQGVISLTAGYGLQIMPGFHIDENFEMMRKIIKEMPRKGGREPNFLFNSLSSDGFCKYSLGIHMPAGYLCIWNTKLPHGLRSYTINNIGGNTKNNQSSTTKMPFVGMYVNMISKNKPNYEKKNNIMSTMVEGTNSYSVENMRKNGLGVNNYNGGLFQDNTVFYKYNQLYKGKQNESGTPGLNFLPTCFHTKPGTFYKSHVQPFLPKIPNILNNELSEKERYAAGINNDRHSMNIVSSNGMKLGDPKRVNASGYLPFIFSKFTIRQQNVNHFPCKISEHGIDECGFKKQTPLVNLPKVNLFSSQCDLPTIFFQVQLMKDTINSGCFGDSVDIYDQSSVKKKILECSKPNFYCRESVDKSVLADDPNWNKYGRKRLLQVPSALDNMGFIFNTPALKMIQGEDPSITNMDLYFRNASFNAYYFQNNDINRIASYCYTSDGTDLTKQEESFRQYLDSQYVAYIRSDKPLMNESPQDCKKRCFLNLLGTGRPEFLFGFREKANDIKSSHVIEPENLPNTSNVDTSNSKTNISGDNTVTWGTDSNLDTNCDQSSTINNNDDTASKHDENDDTDVLMQENNSMMNSTDQIFQIPRHGHESSINNDSNLPPFDQPNTESTDLFTFQFY